MFFPLHKRDEHFQKAYNPEKELKAIPQKVKVKKVSSASYRLSYIQQVEARENDLSKNIKGVKNG